MRFKDDNVQYCVFKCRDKSVLKDSNLQNIFHEHYKGIHDLWSLAMILLQLHVRQSLDNKIDITINEKLLNRCACIINPNGTSPKKKDNDYSLLLKSYNKYKYLLKS